MVEVKLTLFDAQEIVMLAQLEAALDQKRSAAPPFMQAETPQAPEPEPAPAAPEVDDLTIQRAITEYAQRPGKGVPAARELLQEFGVSKVGEIPQERRAEFMAKVNA